MDDINDLRRARAAAVTQMEAKADALAALEDDDTAEASAVEAAQAAFEAAEAAFRKADAKVKRAETVEAAKVRATVPAEPDQNDPDADATVSPRVAAMAREKGLKFGAQLRTLAAAGGDLDKAIRISEANGESGLFATQNVTQNVKGGFLVPEDVADDVIELLRPASVVMRMGPRVIPMPSGNYTQNRRVSGANFAYQGENTDIGVTGYEYGQVKLSAKKLTGIVPISNDLLSFASTAADRMIRDDAIADAGVAMDQAFLRGSGTAFSPKGLRWQAVGTAFEALNILTMTATPDLQKVTDDLGRMELALSNQNVAVSGAHWIMAPRVAMYLRNLRDGNGNYAFPEIQTGTLRGKPVHESTSIPANLGGGTESEIILVSPTHVLVGETNGIAIAMSDQAAYRDENGNLQSAFSRDETLMRAILQHDIGLRHIPAVSVLTGVTWVA